MDWEGEDQGDGVVGEVEVRIRTRREEVEWELDETIGR